MGSKQDFNDLKSRTKINMSNEIERNSRCRACKKIFCCSECCEKHEGRKHEYWEIHCPLCVTKSLPLAPIQDNKLLSHIASKHLPLHCLLCGEVFKLSQDLECFSTCRYWESRQEKLAHQLSTQKIAALSITPSPINRTQSTPAETTNRKLISIDGDYNGNFHSFTSPPELTRNTSTPMHTGIVAKKANLEYKTPTNPNFSLQTPSSQNCHSDNFLSCKSSNFEWTPSSTYKKSGSLQKLEVMKEQEEDIEIRNDDMELTTIEGAGILQLTPEQGSTNKTSMKSGSTKRVRFSNEYEHKVEETAISYFNATDTDEFYEAREDFEEQPPSARFSNTAMKIFEDNERNSEKEKKVEPDNQSSEVSTSSKKQQSSSRVLMMVLVENNSKFCSSELTPLIENGLKKLEQTAANTYSSISSLSRSESRRSITSVDSYVSVSSVECFASPRSSIHSDRESTGSGNDMSSSGGLFSVMAQAVKTAFKNLSGGNLSKSTSKESISQKENTSIRSSNQEASSSTSTFTSIATSLLRRPGKRSRDMVEASTSRAMDIIENTATNNTEITSPVAKRHRGWYKIKGREPIARMRKREVTSPKGISSETQCFQQGSLSVGDTIIPLPSRAHQSTQTD